MIKSRRDASKLGGPSLGSSTLLVWVGYCYTGANGMNYYGLLIAGLAGTLVLPAFSLRGETIPIVNYSFEQPELGTEGQQVLPDSPGWKVSGKTGVFANIGTFGNE